MFIHCSRGTINSTRCPAPDCPSPCPERTERLQRTLDTMRKYQRQLIDTHKDNPTPIYYEIVGAVQERIEAAEAAI